ncbi:putative hypothetical protein [Streptomyces sp. NBRC 110611]|uniref:hypothetical protein n=1 Tax=Streptomyces sp. NBRC 110611 TaxID=1621259 RepID=UPI0008567705|nr:hypothetical protein [Streptomyces sp. NBRC 110611]GAU65725.1 putative hypothetical protein [Streptomyces sp. NBRC 110611]
MTLPHFLDLPGPDPGGLSTLGVLATVGTLGPQGTSSELAAGLLARRLAPSGGEPAAVRLFDTYEEAGDTLRAGLVTHVVVANAYKAVHHFYMDPALALADVFVMDTPLYGIARRRDAAPAPGTPVIASHPSPVPLIAELLPPEHTSHTVLAADSTSAAARAAAAGAADFALTTAPAARLHGLEFVSRTRPIRMVWSVFTGPAATGRYDRFA